MSLRPKRRARKKMRGSNSVKKFISLSVLLLGCVLCRAGATDIFKWSLAENKDSWSVSVNVPGKAYLYQEMTSVTAKNPAGQEIKPLAVPEAAVHTDKDSGEKTPVYSSGISTWKYPKDKGALSFEIAFQGCSEEPLICYPPGQLVLSGGGKSVMPQGVAEKLPLMAKLKSFTVFSSASGYLPSEEFVRFLKGDARGSSDFLEGKSLLIVIFIVVFGGLMLNLTPCVLPLIPVNLAIIGAGFESKSRKGGFVRGLVYGAGMAAAYGVTGIVAVTSGARFGNLNSMSWFNFGVAALFIVFALAMFDLFHIDFSRFGAKINPSATGKGKIVTAFLLGIVAALLAGACIAPVVLAVLLHSARIYSEGSMAGLLLPFLLGIGMALPWPFAGAGLGVIPKPGRWMAWVKYVFGAMILLFGLYYAYIGFSLLPFEGKWSVDAEIKKLESGLDESSKSRRKVLIDFWASWCKNCAQMEIGTMRSPEVEEELKNFIVVKFKAEKPSDPRIKQILDYFNVAGFPSYVILEPAAK